MNEKRQRKQTTQQNNLNIGLTDSGKMSCCEQGHTRSELILPKFLSLNYKNPTSVNIKYA